MKKYLNFIYLLVMVATFVSCNSIESSSDFEKKGTPITAAELKAALSFTQMPNSDTSVEGDQYVIVKNARPDIGGNWHLVYNGTEKVYGTDNDTIICENNGKYQLYYEGISEYQVVKTEPFEFTVTNVFDAWSGYFTGAKDKADVTAAKVWRFRDVVWPNGTHSIANNGAYGGWKYTSAGYVPESNFMWWGNHTMDEAGEAKMVFEYKDNKVKVYNADGSVKYEGTFSFTHDVPDDMVLGTLTLDNPTMGGQWDECLAQKKGSPNVFWILTLDDKYITLFHPEKYTGGVDWDNCGWYVYYQSEK